MSIRLTAICALVVLSFHLFVGCTNRGEPPDDTHTVNVDKVNTHTVNADDIVDIHTVNVHDDVLVMAASSLVNVLDMMQASGNVAGKIYARGIDAQGKSSVAKPLFTSIVAGSSTLVAQLAAGLEADILITADGNTMKQAVLKGYVQGEPMMIASNHLVLATVVGNPGDVSQLTDLEQQHLLVGLCDSEVPCGALAGLLLNDANVQANADTLERSARSLASRLVLGELDAGLIYLTDALALNLPFVCTPDMPEHINRYYIASVAAEPSSSVLNVISEFTAIDGSGAEALRINGFSTESTQTDSIKAESHYTQTDSIKTHGCVQ